MNLFPNLPAALSPATIGNTRLSPEQAAQRGAGKSAFAKDALNRYDTIDPRAVAALLPHLAPRTRFIEPCAGKGDLVRQLQAAGHLCVSAFDIAPRAEGIGTVDAATWANTAQSRDAIIITNPPFDWAMLHPLLENWRDQVLISWLLLPAAFMHTHSNGRGEVIQRTRKIVSIGRLKWVIPSDNDDTKDYCWYQIGSTPAPGNTPAFHGRAWQKVQP
jgi:hypothetical protein